MLITLLPVRGDEPLKIDKLASALIVNGETFDFAFMNEGDTLSRAAVSGDWLASDVTLIDGELRMSVVFPHGRNASNASLFPDPITVTQDGAIALPPYDAPEDLQ
jgi:hypothetical protein